MSATISCDSLLNSDSDLPALACLSSGDQTQSDIQAVRWCNPGMSSVLEHSCVSLVLSRTVLLGAEERFAEERLGWSFWIF